MSVVAFSIGKDPRIDKSVNKTAVANPGPGSYSPPGGVNNRYKASPNVSMSLASRKDMADPEGKKIPGPGNYERRDDLAKINENKGFAMPAKDKFIIKKLPGPGDYSPTNQHQSPQIAMKGRTKLGVGLAVSSDGGHQKMISSDFETTKVPGPGAYALQTDQVTKNNGSVRFGTQTRPGLATAGLNLIPGPNAYARDAKTAVMFTSPRFGFGTSQRSSIENKAKLPGPGTYSSSDAFSSGGRTIGNKLFSPKPSHMHSPPPGTYDQKSIFNQNLSPSWRMGTAHRDVAHRMMSRTCNFPPPDSYAPDFNKAKDKQPQFSFNKGPRMSQTPQNKQPPGPGTYVLPSKGVEGKKTSMGLKLDNFGSTTSEIRKTRGFPGAGTYTGDFNKIAKNNGSYSMRPKNTPTASTHVPGPGQYEHKKDKGKTAPSFGFGRSQQREPLPKEKAPGPGGYSVPCTIGHMPAYTNARPKDFGYL